MNEAKYKMSINLNVLNHLGIKLYSNVPAVLSEVVANSWDADAENVDIEIKSDQITITDDGHGMTFEDINEKYLMVGYERRTHETGKTAKHGRLVMGRKGIGKLSLFSIADTVEVQTIQDGKKNGFVMSAQKIESQIQKGGSTYNPDPLHESQVDLHKDGTRIVLTRLKKRVSQAASALRKRLARRFSIIGTEYNFTVCINENPVEITDRDYFHKLQYLWYYGETSQKYIQFCNSQKLEHHELREGKIEVENEGEVGAFSHQVTGWIGTALGSGDLKDGEDNLNKIVIMVRGKLAQEDILEDFTEGGLYTKYLIGEIHADFLDVDNEEDIATSNRQEIIKDDPRYLALRDWVKGELRNIKGQWTALRNEKGIEEARQIPAIDKWVQDLGPDKQKQAKSLLGKIGQLTLEEDERLELYRHSVLAFESLNYKDSLSALDKISSENIQDFTRAFANLDKIEAALYYQIVQERLKVIDTLRDNAKSNVLEKVIQEHLYEHLWLLDPAWDRATETPLMEQNVKTAFDEIDAKLTDEEQKGRFDIKYKMTSGKHVIIELKRSKRVMDDFELIGQVDKYRTALQKLLEEINKDEPVEVVCIVGQLLRQWTNPREREISRRSLAEKGIRVVLYDELIEDAYRSYRAFIKKNRKADRIYQLIQNIETEEADTG